MPHKKYKRSNNILKINEKKLSAPAVSFSNKQTCVVLLYILKTADLLICFKNTVKTTRYNSWHESCCYIANICIYIDVTSQPACSCLLYCRGQ